MEEIKMKLDFSEVKQNKMVAEGTNDLTIFGAKEAKSQNGTNMLILDMKDVEEGFIRDNICLEGAGAFRAKQLIKALGLDEDTFAGMEAADLIGNTVTAEVIYEEYNGEQRAKVKKYIA